MVDTQFPNIQLLKERYSLDATTLLLYESLSKSKQKQIIRKLLIHQNFINNYCFRSECIDILLTTFKPVMLNNFKWFIQMISNQLSMAKAQEIYIIIKQNNIYQIIKKYAANSKQMIEILCEFLNITQNLSIKNRIKKAVILCRQQSRLQTQIDIFSPEYPLQTLKNMNTIIKQRIHNIDNQQSLIKLFINSGLIIEITKLLKENQCHFQILLDGFIRQYIQNQNKCEIAVCLIKQIQLFCGQLDYNINDLLQHRCIGTLATVSFYTLKHNNQVTHDITTALIHTLHEECTLPVLSNIIFALANIACDVKDTIIQLLEPFKLINLLLNKVQSFKSVYDNECYMHSYHKLLKEIIMLCYNLQFNFVNTFETFTFIQKKQVMTLFSYLMQCNDMLHRNTLMHLIKGLIHSEISIDVQFNHALCDSDLIIACITFINNQCLTSFNGFHHYAELVATQTILTVTEGFPVLITRDRVHKLLCSGLLSAICKILQSQEFRYKSRTDHVSIKTRTYCIDILRSFVRDLQMVDILLDSGTLELIINLRLTQISEHFNSIMLLISDSINELKKLNKLNKSDMFCNKDFLQYMMNCLISNNISIYTAERMISAIKIIHSECNETDTLSVMLQ